MRTIELQVYSYEELSEEAKKVARDKYRESNASDDWYSEPVIEDLKTVAEHMGVEIGVRNKHPEINLSGFCSQGDGASFFGEYTPVENAEAAIKEYAPKDETLHKIAQELDAVRKELTHRKYTCTITKQCNHYSHSGTMSVNMLVDDEGEDEMSYEEIKPLEDRVQAALRNLADWFYEQLEAAYDYYQTDEYVAEQLSESDAEFHVDGTEY